METPDYDAPGPELSGEGRPEQRDTSPAELPPLSHSERAELERLRSRVETLSDAERDELRRLREDRILRETRAAEALAVQQAKLTKPTHHVVLSDGTVVEGSQIATHHTFGDGSGHPAGDRTVEVSRSHRIHRQGAMA